MLNITVVQPRYYSGDEPDKVIAEFLMNELEKEPTKKNIIHYVI